jgi:hypothetical protein
MNDQPGLDVESAARFARLALDCVRREYPNKIAHVMSSDADTRPPRSLTPAFYGCFDWHSAVHAHWMLARLARKFPDAAFASAARAALGRNLTPENLLTEAAYMAEEGRESFERPYGLAWLLQLSAELREWPDADADRWFVAIEPLEAAVAARFRTWLPKLSHPVRSGEHSQTAFALGLCLDWARGCADEEFEQLVKARALHFFAADRNCPAGWEPSGEDFLSPSLAEADVMRRVLPTEEFREWFDAFLPDLQYFPLTVTDAADGKLAHLDGLNLSRAWMMKGIAAGLGVGHGRHDELVRFAEAHASAGLRAVTGEHYAGGHWLGSFAVYLTTGRGL